MRYQFKKFQNRNARLEDRITITKSFSIGFPTKFYRDNNIRSYKYVELYYDEREKVIGIHFTNDSEGRSAYSIVHSKQGYGGNIVVRSFFNTYNIDPERYHGKYEWKKHPLEGVGELFVVDLKERETRDAVAEKLVKPGGIEKPD